MFGEEAGDCDASRLKREVDEEVGVSCVGKEEMGVDTVASRNSVVETDDGGSHYDGQTTEDFEFDDEEGILWVRMTDM